MCFSLEIKPLSPEDAILDYGPLGNFSLAGFEMVLTRYVSTYIITYYLPSGEGIYISQTFVEFKGNISMSQRPDMADLITKLVNLFYIKL